MAARQLSVRSERAIALAHMLAQRERRTVAAVVEAALDRYAAQTAIAEPITDFLARLQEGKTAADDQALDRVMSAIAAEKKPHAGIDV